MQLEKNEKRRRDISVVDIKSREALTHTHTLCARVGSPSGGNPGYEK